MVWPISCDSLFPVAQALIERLNHREDGARPNRGPGISCQRSARFTETDLDMPVFPIYLPSAFRNSAPWSRQLDIYHRIKRIFVGEEMGHDWLPRISKAESDWSWRARPAVAFTVIVSLDV